MAICEWYKNPRVSYQSHLQNSIIFIKNQHSYAAFNSEWGILQIGNWGCWRVYGRSWLILVLFYLFIPAPKIPWNKISFQSDEVMLWLQSVTHPSQRHVSQPLPPRLNGFINTFSRATPCLLLFWNCHSHTLALWQPQRPVRGKKTQNVSLSPWTFVKCRHWTTFSKGHTHGIFSCSSWWVERVKYSFAICSNNLWWVQFVLDGLLHLP